MAYWASYIAFSFDHNKTNELLNEARVSLADFNDHIAWHDTHYLHLTMHFLGWLTESDAKQVSQVVNNCDISNIKLQTSGDLTLLGFDEKKEYVALCVTPTKQLLSLRKKIEEDLLSVGIKVKEQPFLPHISLGRVHNLDDINDIKLKSNIIPIQKLNIFSSTSSSLSLNNQIMGHYRARTR